MKFIKKISLILLILSGCLVHTQAFSQPAISGISLGMSVDQGRASHKSAKIRSIYRLQSNGTPVGFVGNTELDSPNLNGSGREEIFAYQGDAAAVWFIQRWQNFEPSERYTLDELIKALKNNFGNEVTEIYLEPNKSLMRSDLPGDPETRIGWMSWYFDLNGKHSKDPTICYGREHTTAGGPSRIPSDYKLSAVGQIPDPINPKCGRFYFAMWTAINGLVHNLYVGMEDGTAILSAIKSREQKAKDEKTNQIELQKSKGIKPSL